MLPAMERCLRGQAVLLCPEDPSPQAVAVHQEQSLGLGPKRVVTRVFLCTGAPCQPEVSGSGQPVQGRSWTAGQQIPVLSLPAVLLGVMSTLDYLATGEWMVVTVQGGSCSKFPAPDVDGAASAYSGEGQFTHGLLEAQGRFQVGSAVEEPLERAGETAVGYNSCTQTQDQECNVFLLKFFFLPASLIFKSLWFTLEFCNPNIVYHCAI